MKILFASFLYDYGDPKRGEAFEYVTFYQTLTGMQDIEVEFFAVDKKMFDVGRDEMNKELILKVQETKPDLLFCFLFEDEIKKETIDHITSKTGTKTFNWFADDHWRLPIFSRHYAPLFTKVSTTDSEAIEKYSKYGIHNVIKTQWAANTSIYKPVPMKFPVPDVTFVGQNIGKRQSFVSYLNERGLPVTAYGKGWEAGRIPIERMLEIFSNSKVNLNFVQIPFIEPRKVHNALLKLFIKKQAGKFVPDFRNFKDNLNSLLAKRTLMIKGRNFEVPACGGFMLTGYADNLRDYYEPDREIVVFDSLDELIEKCKYYLVHEDDRKAIALAGYRRTLEEHTYEHRFNKIFRELELR